ncbi:MAG: hypothetical protein K0S45_3571 [Nitrospira sp.]|jgi:ribosomal protein S12 methylthiotransferase accessory factor|nr:hypothetical protein [Nitrospira sp.]
MNPSLEMLSESITSLVDESVGIVRYVTEVPAEAGSPNFFHFYARACDTRSLCPQRNSADAGGASSERDRALAKAIGEAVERYCSSIYFHEELPLSTFENASFLCVAPETFALYRPHQYRKRSFPFRPFNRSTIVRWTPALDPKTGQIHHIPAAMVFVPYLYDKDRDEFPILQPISTGLACHVGPTRASLSAICEVLERDAFTITWQARLQPPQIILESLDHTNLELVKRFERIGSRLTLFRLKMDHDIPVIFSVLRNNCSDAPALVFALSCHLNPSEAVRKSLEELAHSYRFCRLLKASRHNFTPNRCFTNVVDRDSHVALYCDHGNAHLVDYLFKSEKRINFTDITNHSTGDLDQDLAILIDRIVSGGHQVLLADVTTTDVKSLGFSVMRAVIPGFHPLCVGHHLRALGGDRLWEIPQRLGYRGILRSQGDNPIPHPLP